MAKSRPTKAKKASRQDAILHRTLPPSNRSIVSEGAPTASSIESISAKELLSQASIALQTGAADLALSLASRALALLCDASNASNASKNESNSSSIIRAQIPLPALDLLGQIHLELGDPSSARTAFERAAALDPKKHNNDDDDDDDEIGSPAAAGAAISARASKFLWLAQLCEGGGRESLAWFGRGVEVLCTGADRLVLYAVSEAPEAEGLLEVAVEVGAKAALAVCGMVEVWMTDLS